MLSLMHCQYDKLFSLSSSVQVSHSHVSALSFFFSCSVTWPGKTSVPYMLVYQCVSVYPHVLPSSPPCSMPLPLVADLLKTCVDDVIRTPVPMATAGLPEEAGPSMAASASSLTADDAVSLAGELTRPDRQQSCKY